MKAPQASENEPPGEAPASLEEARMACTSSAYVEGWREGAVRARRSAASVASSTCGSEGTSRSEKRTWEMTCGAGGVGREGLWFWGGGRRLWGRVSGRWAGTQAPACPRHARRQAGSLHAWPVTAAQPPAAAWAGTRRNVPAETLRRLGAW